MLEADCVWNLVTARAALSGRSPCAIDEHDEVLTFAALRDRAEELARELAGLGVGRDSVVSWQLPNRIETVVLTIALARLGAVQNPIVPICREAEVSFITHELRSTLLITPGTWRGFDYAAMARSVARSSPGLRTVVADPELPPGTPGLLPPEPSDDGQEPPVRWVLYTSGTTAAPKGAAHTDCSVMASARNIARRMHMGPADRNAIVFPFAHVGGIWFLLGNLMSGAASVLVERFDDDAIDVLSRHGVTLAGSGPPFNQAYLRRRRALGPSVLPSVRAFPGGGQARPPGMHAELVAAFGGAGIISGYGSTESGSVSMADIEDPDDVRAATEGRPYEDTEVKIADADGRPLPQGAEGEIRVRGPGMIRSYVDPSLNADAFDDEGYFRTGDLGYLDAGGNLVISGRLKDIIIRNGENISAQQVENLLAEHPAVADVAVIGVPDSRTGERACAVVVVADGADRPTLDQVGAYLRGRGLAAQKTPEQLEFVTTIPRNSNGKQLKAALRERFASAR